MAADHPGGALESLTFDQFVGCLRSALHHLYDPDQLRRSPLATLFGVGGFDAAAALQRILTDAIEALQPRPTEPPQSRAWRIYDALAYRYVRGFDRDVVADQLGISGRQLRREQRAALEVLADQLWRQFGLAAAPAASADPPEAAALAAGPANVIARNLFYDEAIPSGAELAAAPPAGLATPALHRAQRDASATAPDAAAKSAAPAWLRDLPPEKPAELGQLLATTLELARPLARQWDVTLKGDLADAARGMAAPQGALRHALLNLLGIAIPRSRGGAVTVSVTLAGAMMQLVVTAGGAAAALAAHESNSLEVARRLAEVAGGDLALGADPGAGPFVACLNLPALERISVLAVDDNADILQLFERYTAGSRYALIGTREPGQCLRLAQEFDPDIIVLDVMMPEIDGWDLLAQLRSDPATTGAPIIICTVLPQEALALALGAHAFLQKPVSQSDFLAALDRLALAQGDP
jgi:CheY-like chemotaxis protein